MPHCEPAVGPPAFLRLDAPDGILQAVLGNRPDPGKKRPTRFRSAILDVPNDLDEGLPKDVLHIHFALNRRRDLVARCVRPAAESATPTAPAKPLGRPIWTWQSAVARQDHLTSAFDIPPNRPLYRTLGTPPFYPAELPRPQPGDALPPAKRPGRPRLSRCRKHPDRKSMENARAGLASNSPNTIGRASGWMGEKHEWGRFVVLRSGVRALDFDTGNCPSIHRGSRDSPTLPANE